jgi:hypothetical protein
MPFDGVHLQTEPSAEEAAKAALHDFWTAKLATAETALAARRQWLRDIKLTGTRFFSDFAEVSEVELCKTILAKHAETAAREARIAARAVAK